MNFDGKVAIVTGGRRGIGRAIAEVLAQRGAGIVLADRQAEEATAAAQEITAATGRRVQACLVDVADFASANAMIECALAFFGRVYILVTTAGITRDTLILRME